MVDINAACELYVKEFPNERIEIVTDIGHSFVIGSTGRNGEEIDHSPFMVNKQTGKISVCFPPHHWDELKNGKPVKVPVKYQPVIT